MAHKEDRQARVPLHGLIHQGVQVLDHALPAVFIGKMPLYLGGTAMAGMVVHIDRKAVFSQKSGEMVIPAAVLGHSVGDDYDCPGLGVLLHPAPGEDLPPAAGGGVEPFFYFHYRPSLKSI